jgi:DNA mismatch repair protein MutS
LAAKLKKGKEETPLMKQYAQIKAKYPGALVLFRVGDFYETFNQDAVEAARVLDIVLTKRANGKASHVELAGFPHHALDTYLPKLVRAGHRVAICDQLEEPQKGKKLVRRGVTELVTPGVTLNEKVLEARQSNYLCSVQKKDKVYGLAFLDISTGEFLVAEGHFDFAQKLLQSLTPSEVLLSKPQRNRFEKDFGQQYHTYVLDEWICSYDFGIDRLLQHFKTKNLKGFGIEHMEVAIAAAGSCLFYLEQTHHDRIEHINSISRIEEGSYVWMDNFTIRNLELLYPLQSGGRSLKEVLDFTATPMGGRLLTKWIALPLKEKSAIEARLDMVEFATSKSDFLERSQEHLRHIGDLERLVSKISAARINPREVRQLARSLEKTHLLKEELRSHQKEATSAMARTIVDFSELLVFLNNRLEDQPPLLTNKGGIFKTGVDAALDEVRELAFKGKDKLLEIQQREMEKTGISSLKIAFNNVFGYYIEVRNTHKDKVPAEWIRKQTLVNAERYITEELKVYEEKILNAEQEMEAMEQRMFQELVNHLQDYIEPIQKTAQIVAKLDCLLSFAQASVSFGYSRPKIEDHTKIILHEARHPVIERQLERGDPYIPNDLMLNDSDQQVIMLTGPNMSGKSALLRQTALAVIMAQMGCFVSAKHAEIGITDKIYTRVGASDNISQGESTFMVEMTETASILNNISERSLILLDEIGRGTSTYDGVSLAWAIASFLATHPDKPKTLFATHYHELNDLENLHESVKNYHVTTKEVGKKVIFLRKIERGGSEHSFGIHVARMAGVPMSVVKQAEKILTKLEEDKSQVHHAQSAKAVSNDIQLQLFSIEDPEVKKVLEMLKNIDPNTLSPIEALLKLNELKDLVDS